MLSRANALVLLNTIGLSLVKTGLSMALALFLAWIVARTDTPYRESLEVMITLPFYIPPILTAMAWGMLATPKGGLLNLAWTGLTGQREPLINIYSYGGVVWHMMQYSTPFLFLLMVGAFKSMDPALEESSRMSGASAWTTFRRVTLGLMLPGHHERLHPLVHPRGGELRVGAHLRHAGRHRGDHHRDLSPDPPRQPARLSTSDGARARDHGPHVRAGGLAVAAARRAELLHGHRQGLHAPGEPAGPLAVGDLRRSASCSSW